MITYKVRGGRELRRSLRAAGLNIRDLSKVNRAVGSIVANASRATAPARTGRLRDSVRPLAQQSRVRIQSRVIYAGPQHWGWKARNIDPKPWLSLTAQATESTWINLYFAEMNRITRTIKGI